MAGWAAFAIGILIKGPLIAAVLGLTALSVSLWDRDWRWISQLRPLSGLALTLVLVLPWFIAIGIASHGAFFSQALGHDFAGKLVGGQESHGAPPGYYLIATTLTLWPATLFVLPGIGRALGRRTEPAMRFLLGWAGASWLMFALVPTKLPHYILPVYPALAFMGTLWLMGEGEETGSGRILRWIASVQFVIGTLALSAGLVFLPIKYGDGAPSWLMLLAGLAALTGIAAAVLMAKQRRIYALAAAAMTALIVYPTLMWGVGPRLEKIWVSPRLAALVAKDKRPGDPPVVTSGYDEPSLIFLLGTHTRIAGPAEAAAITASTGGLALIGKKQDQPFRMRLSALGASARAVDHLSGINYSHGRAVAITIYRVTPAPKYALAE
jgi:4-amino-4-deoxy-L-arabinose transferase-like glycosyltransferase